METDCPNESYVEYEYHGSSPIGMNETSPPICSRPPLNDAVYDEEYVYDQPKLSSNRHASFSRPEVVYYDVDPDFEPHGEYVIDQLSHKQKNLPNNSGNSTNKP